MTDTKPVVGNAHSFTHPGYARLFKRGELTLGLIMPLETYPDAPAPTMQGHLKAARDVEQAGLSAIWMRDIPFYEPSYGDAGQVFEPLAYISALSMVTSKITLGTAGIVLPLRDPKLLAKQATTVDHLSNGRLVLGLSSGDRPSEYPLFDIDFDNRGDIFRDAFGVYRTITDEDYPHFQSRRFGRGVGLHDLLPKPPFGRTPSIAIGRSQQSIEWIAATLDGIIAPSPPVAQLDAFAGEWHSLVRQSCGEQVFKPIGLAGYLDLVEDRDYPLQHMRSGIRTGSKALAEFLHSARDAGVNHAALNPKISSRPHAALMDDLARDVLPHFPSHDAPSAKAA